MVTEHAPLEIFPIAEIQDELLIWLTIDELELHVTWAASM
jgi:hypothetical protein